MAGTTVSVTFAQSFFEQNVSVQLNYCDFQRFLLFRNKAEWRRTGISFAVTSGQRRPDEDYAPKRRRRNKARNARRFAKNAGMREIYKNAGFPARLRDG